MERSLIIRSQPKPIFYEVCGLKDPLTAIFLHTEMVLMQISQSREAQDHSMINALIEKTQFETMRLNLMLDRLIEKSAKIEMIKL